MVTDLEILQGKWRQVSFAENGLIDPHDSHGAVGAVMTVSGSSFDVAIPGGTTIVKGNFVLNASANPKTIDWIDSMGEDAGEILPAIYKLSSNSFEFAAADAGMKRPRDFTGGQGITVRAFVRV